MIFTLPNVLRDLNTSDWSTTEQELLNRDSLEFSLYAATIPEVSIPATRLPTYGQTVNVTSQVREAYPPVNCKFVVDNRFKNYWVLWKWLETINDPRKSGMDESLALQVNTPTTGQIANNTATDFWGYQTQISIFPLDEFNKEMCEFIFYNSFITKLAGMNFNYQDATQMECDFTFEFGQMDIRIIE